MRRQARASLVVGADIVTRPGPKPGLEMAIETISRRAVARASAGSRLVVFTPDLFRKTERDSPDKLLLEKGRNVL